MAEKEYIEREAFLDAIERGKKYQQDADDIAEMLQNFPAADVRHVARGKWVNDRNGKYSASGDNFYCSICKDPSLRAFGKPAKTNYCPNCGADMRIFSANCKNTVTTGEDREISNLRAMSKKESKVMGVYIPNLDEKKFYEICKEHNLDFIAIPADDVRPVVKSKWIKMKFFPDWECEKCGSVISGNTPDPWNHYHFCPNCGAMMEEN